MSETEAKPLYGAAKAAADRKRGGTLDEFLAQLSEGLDTRIGEAQEVVAARQEELDVARRNLRVLEQLQAVQQGKFQLTAPEQARARQATQRSPRAQGKTISDKIMEIVREAMPEGAVIADILPKVREVAGGDDQKTRNQVAQLVNKRGALKRHESGFYMLVS